MRVRWITAGRVWKWICRIRLVVHTLNYQPAQPFRIRKRHCSRC
jgi:hypothetical protein